jgi:tetratricopeptide (TPR) repeat protein
MKAFFTHCRLSLTSLLIITGLSICVSALRQNTYAQTPAATPTVRKLANDVTMEFVLETLNRESVPIETRNSALIRAVKARHIKFVLEEEEEKQLTEAGASEALIAAIRKESSLWDNTPFYYFYRGNKFQTLGKKFSDLANGFRANKNEEEAKKNEEEAKKHLDKAITNYQLLIALDPEYKTDYAKTANNNLGVVYDLLKNYDEAITYFSKAIALEPASARYFNRGAMYEKRGSTKKDMAEKRADFDKAVEDYTKAIEFDNSYIPAYKQRASVHQLWGRKELAEADEKRVRELRSGASQPVSLDSKP